MPASGRLSCLGPVPSRKNFYREPALFQNAAVHDKSLAIKTGMSTISYLIREPLGSGLGDLRSAGSPAIRYSPLSLQIYRPRKRRVKRRHLCGLTVTGADKPAVPKGNRVPKNTSCQRGKYLSAISKICFVSRGCVDDSHVRIRFSPIK